MIIDIPMSYFLLLIAGLAAVVTFAVVPKVPVVALVSASAVTMAGAIVWHWLQFSTDYRTNTWMEQLRNYSSYVMLFAIFLVSFGFYTFAWMNKGLTPQAEVASNSRDVLNVVPVVTDSIKAITRMISQPLGLNGKRNGANGPGGVNGPGGANSKKEEKEKEEEEDDSVLSNFLF